MGITVQTMARRPPNTVIMGANIFTFVNSGL